MDKHESPQATPLRVSIALHVAPTRGSGEVRQLEMALQRCTNLRAIAHGGQTVLSGAVYDLVAGQLPLGAVAAELGLRRLQDLGRPERVFELRPAAAAPLFPPPRSLDLRPNNLPEQFTSFVGREQELDELSQAMLGERLLVLTGAGGCGKTRLALQAVAASIEHFPDGAWWVELAPLTDASLVGAALAEALGVDPPAGRSSLQAVVDRLACSRAVLVLDNCEHVTEGAAEVCEALMAGCAQLAVVATSRSPLYVSGERDWQVPPLALPAEAAGMAVTSLARADAVRLFVERAVAVRRGFELTDENAAAVARICCDLEGIPLAIELAAARVRALSPDQIVVGLDDRLALLSGRRRGADARQQTVRASIDWSFELLSDAERALLARLAVFAGGWTLEAADAICGTGASAAPVLEGLTSLVDKSLVITDDRHGMHRYRMLETVREYAAELLAASGDEAQTRQRHLGFFLALVESVAPGLATAGPAAPGPAGAGSEPAAPEPAGAEPAAPEPAGSERAAPEPAGAQLQASSRTLLPDAENVAAALQHATRTDPRCALVMCAALTWWWMGGRYAAGELACAHALAAAGEVLPDGDREVCGLRARVAWCRAYLARHLGEYRASYAHANEAMALAEAVGDGATSGRALFLLGSLRLFPDPAGSRPGLERAIELAKQIGDEWLLAHAIATLGFSYLFTDEIDEALRWFRDGVAFGERVGAESLMWYWIGFTWASEARAESGSCFEMGERAVSAAREASDPVGESLAQWFMAMLEVAQGRPKDALERLRQSEARLVASGGTLALPQTRAAMARALAATGAPDQARELLEQVVAGGADGGYNLALALTFLADLLRSEDLLDEAVARARQALELGEPIGSRNLAASSREVLGRLAARRGDWTAAENLLQSSLADRAAARLSLYLPQTLDALAEAVAGLDSHEEAARLRGAAQRARRELGLVCWPPDEAGASELEHRLRLALGAAGYEAARDEGATMTLDEAVDWARRARGKRKRPASGWESLTPTEHRVVALVCEGLTNPEIATRMFVSRATVKVHLQHIFSKLGVRTRAELTARALRSAAERNGAERTGAERTGAERNGAERTGAAAWGAEA